MRTSSAGSRSGGEAGFTLVELLVTVVVMGVISGGITSAIIAAQRASTYQQQLQQVVDDGRLSLNRIRQELREGRRVLSGSTAHKLYWWVDNNQDGIAQPSERVHFCVAPLSSLTCVTTSQTGQFRLLRYTDAAPSTVTMVASTLTTTDVFSGYAADDPATPIDEISETAVVNIALALEVLGGRGPAEINLESDVRLRNVA